MYILIILNGITSKIQLRKRDMNRSLSTDNPETEFDGHVIIIEDLEKIQGK